MSTDTRRAHRESSQTPEDRFLHGFVPAALADRIGLPDGALSPAEVRFDAVILVADISGFTALAEHLAQRGAEGAELLTSALNRYFTSQLAVIAAHGGEATKFAGDATIALWTPREGESLQDHVSLAARCALTLQKTIGPPVHGERLRLRVGIAAGRVWAGRVGGVGGQWDHLLAGTVVADAARAASVIDPGEVGVGASAVLELDGLATTEPVPGGGGRLRAVQPAAAARTVRRQLLPLRAELRSAFVPRLVTERVAAGQTAWLAEFRRLTVVFLSIGHIDIGDETLGRAQAAMSAVQDTVYRFDGSVNQVIADDKGTSFVLGWNLPGLAREDSASRAVRAALDLHSQLADLGFVPAIGVSTGRGFCGLRGGDDRREYAMVGAVVNRAARLMQAAGARILCDDATADAAGRRVSFSSAGELRVKGVSQPVPIFTPAGAATERGPAGSLTGRARELAAFDNALARVRADRGSRVLILEGEPGIGKSRLIAACLERAQRAGVRTLASAADAVEATTSHFVWRRIFEQILGSSSANPEAARSEVRRRLGDDPDAVARLPLLSTIVPLDLPESETTRQMTAEARAERTRDLLIALLQSEGPAPLVIALDDGHWFDSASWALAAAVSRRMESVLLLIGTRPVAGPQPVDRGQVVLSAGEGRLVVDPLSEDDVMAVVLERLGVRVLPRSVAAFVHRKAAGNPFFSEQLVYALRDRGDLRVEGNRCVLAPTVLDLDRLALPETLEGVITGRVDALQPGPQLTLKVASVIGRAFRVPTLRAVYPFESSEDVEDHLATLVEHELILPQTTGPDAEYLFKHVVLQDVVYGLMTFAQRRELHRSLATWFETRHAQDLDPFLGLLAHHWRNTDDAAKAVEYLERAGQQAFENSANEETIRLVHDAAEIADRQRMPIDALRRARWDWWGAFAFIRLGHYQRAGEWLQAGLTLLGESVPHSNAAVAARLLSQLAVQLRRHLLPYRQRMPSPCDRERALLAADLYHRYLEVQYYAGGPLRSLAGTVACLNACEPAGRSAELAVTYCIAGYWVGVLGLRRVAARYFADAEPMVEESGHLASIGYFHLAGATYSWTIGAWANGERHCARGIEVYRRAGDKNRVETILAGPGLRWYLQGDYDRALPWIEKTEASAFPHGAPPPRIWCSALRILMASRRGDPLAPYNCRLEADLDEHVDVTDQIIGLSCLALGTLHADGVAPAREYAERALELTLAHPPVHVIASLGMTALASALVTMYEATDEPAERTRLKLRSAQACRALQQFARFIQTQRPAAYLYDGRRLKRQGESRRAARRLIKAVAAGEALDMSYETACAHYELSTMDSVGPAVRERHARRAADLFGASRLSPRPAIGTGAA